MFPMKKSAKSLFFQNKRDSIRNFVLFSCNFFFALKKIYTKNKSFTACIILSLLKYLGKINRRMFPMKKSAKSLFFHERFSLLNCGYCGRRTT
jgi:hypothetical protein